MKKAPEKTPTPTVDNKKAKSSVKSHRKNTTPSTRGAERQRSGSNDPQRGSH